MGGLYARRTALQGYLAYDDARRQAAGVLLLHRRDGMSNVTLGKRQMYASKAICICGGYFRRRNVRPKTVSEKQAQSTLYSDDRPLMRARAMAGFDVLRANAMVDPAKIAIVGYCFGGEVAIELAETGTPILGTVTSMARSAVFREKRRGTSMAGC